jgi:hypothetical protein
MCLQPAKYDDGTMVVAASAGGAGTAPTPARRTPGPEHGCEPGPVHAERLPVPHLTGDSGTEDLARRAARGAVRPDTPGGPKLGFKGFPTCALPSLQRLVCDAKPRQWIVLVSRCNRACRRTC